MKWSSEVAATLGIRPSREDRYKRALERILAQKVHETKQYYAFTLYAQEEAQRALEGK